MLAQAPRNNKLSTIRVRTRLLVCGRIIFTVRKCEGTTYWDGGSTIERRWKIHRVLWFRPQHCAISRGWCDFPRPRLRVALRQTRPGIVGQPVVPVALHARQ